MLRMNWGFPRTIETHRVSGGEVCPAIGVRLIGGLVGLLIVGVSPTALGQESVRAVHAFGQTFVVWENTGQPPVTYEIYRASTPFTDISQATLTGRLFLDEMRGERLDYVSQIYLQQNAYWRIPLDNSGATYTLIASEGLFVFTPHEAADEYFAVVKTGETLVDSSNITSSAVHQTYDPVGDPVQCHAQLQGMTPQGYPFRIYATWSDGRDDPDDRRPDVPVTANFAKNGAPHVFAIHTPPDGPGDGPYPAVFGLHGGGGNFDLFRPGRQVNIGMEVDRGIVIGPSEHIVYQWEDRLMKGTTGAWLGYVSDFDPFTTDPRTDPPPDSVVINYAMRRVMWILDWLLGPDSGFEIDPGRVSMLGHSAGGRGTSMITRWKPERFSSATLFTPALQAGTDDPNPLIGSNSANLLTNIIRNEEPVHVNDVRRWSVRLSDTQRDLCPTRSYMGRSDLSLPWSPSRVGEYIACDDSALGFFLYWDERDHGVPQWSTEDPKNPGPDIGQWVSPERTDLGTAAYQHRYRADQSFPAFFHEDRDPNVEGQQPDIGNGDPDDGDAWGTWSGYADWDQATLIDAPTEWAAVVWLIGLSATEIDNCPVAETTISIAPRKTQSFNPPADSMVYWSVNTLDDVLREKGIVAADDEGVVRVEDIVVTRDPDRVRLRATTTRPLRADLNWDGDVDIGDYRQFASCLGGPGRMPESCEDADLDEDGDVDVRDFAILQTQLE